MRHKPILSVAAAVLLTIALTAFPHMAIHAADTATTSEAADSDMISEMVDVLEDYGYEVTEPEENLSAETADEITDETTEEITEASSQKNSENTEKAVIVVFICAVAGGLIYSALTSGRGNAGKCVLLSPFIGWIEAGIVYLLMVAVNFLDIDLVIFYAFAGYSAMVFIVLALAVHIIRHDKFISVHNRERILE